MALQFAKEFKLSVFDSDIKVLNAMVDSQVGHIRTLSLSKEDSLTLVGTEKGVEKQDLLKKDGLLSHLAEKANGSSYEQPEQVRETILKKRTNLLLQIPFEDYEAEESQVGVIYRQFGIDSKRLLTGEPVWRCGHLLDSSNKVHSFWKKSLSIQESLRFEVDLYYGKSAKIDNYVSQGALEFLSFLPFVTKKRGASLDDKSIYSSRLLLVVQQLVTQKLASVLSKFTTAESDFDEKQKSKYSSKKSSKLRTQDLKNQKDTGKLTDKDFSKDFIDDFINDSINEPNKKYSQDYIDNFNKKYSKDYIDDVINNSINESNKKYSQDYIDNFNKKYSQDYIDNFNKKYSQDYIDDFNKKYSQDYIDDFINESNKKYSQDYIDDFIEDSSNDYIKDFSKDFSKAEATSSFLKTLFRSTALKGFVGSSQAEYDSLLESVVEFSYLKPPKFRGDLLSSEKTKKRQNSVAFKQLAATELRFAVRNFGRFCSSKDLFTHTTQLQKNSLFQAFNSERLKEWELFCGGVLFEELILSWFSGDSSSVSHCTEEHVEIAYQFWRSTRLRENARVYAKLFSQGAVYYDEDRVKYNHAGFVEPKWVDLKTIETVTGEKIESTDSVVSLTDLVGRLDGKVLVDGKVVLVKEILPYPRAEGLPNTFFGFFDSYRGCELAKDFITSLKKSSTQGHTKQGNTKQGNTKQGNTKQVNTKQENSKRFSRKRFANLWRGSIVSGAEGTKHSFVFPIVSLEPNKGDPYVTLQQRARLYDSTGGRTKTKLFRKRPSWFLVGAYALLWFGSSIRFESESQSEFQSESQS